MAKYKIKSEPEISENLKRMIEEYETQKPLKSYSKKTDWPYDSFSDFFEDEAEEKLFWESAI